MIFAKQFMLDEFTPIALYEKIKNHFDQKTFLFESVVNTSDGNFSYIIAGEKEAIWSQDGKSYYKKDGETEEIDSNPLLFMKRYYQNIDFAYHKKISKELGVGFIDGFIGYIGYDMVQEFEPVLKPFMENLKDELHTPDFYMIRPKLIIAYSHKNSTLTLLCSDEETKKSYFDLLEKEIKDSYSYTPLKKAKLLGAPTFAHSKERFFEMVKKSKEMIRSGDVFQIVISNRLKQQAVVDRFSFYRKLRSLNPSPYLFLLEFQDFAIAGSSPEVMVRLTDGEILLRPIAGTRKRGNTPTRDKELELEMLNDPKEVAEHVMLIDLGRNDVGRVAKPGTVKVPEVMRVERYSHVMHMVSDVVARLDEKYDMFDLFMATFTAGTMTGAPKIRAMELIAEFEQLKRGFYSGSVGYFGFTGDMDSAITIRTAMLKKDEVIFQAGAGIVADSKPELEYLEVNNKLGALKRALEELAE
ncbi:MULTISPECIES: anthranilate synthase component I family protein [unclassified Nitratiruptor]|uniref:anthranilate synthase component I family protein n=1 Tax=unclassified Nitratiruptor TaxID=2624044 RepID=UPI0019153CFA|nr:MULTISPECIES: anthranilate synthase component I family protein [unclassified Nitratiruptor]BCD60098.1 anthranilate synthase component I [Nitratiruptor sp. YY08-10]BCD64413.1 anthranilate synthase component I [Nitratiruptor sp. YY08-14]